MFSISIDQFVRQQKIEKNNKICDKNDINFLRSLFKR